MVCLTLFCIGGHFALFPNVLKRIYGKQATVLYGVLFTGTGLASLTIVGLLFTPISDQYDILYYFFGCLQFVALLILLFCYKESRFEPDWVDILGEDQMQPGYSAAPELSRLNSKDDASNLHKTPPVLMETVDERDRLFDGGRDTRKAASSLQVIKRKTMKERKCNSEVNSDDEEN